MKKTNKKKNRGKSKGGKEGSAPILSTGYYIFHDSIQYLKIYKTIN